MMNMYVVDHIRPLSYRAQVQGDNNFSNLVLSCEKCNNIKGDKGGYTKPTWIRVNPVNPISNKFSPSKEDSPTDFAATYERSLDKSREERHGHN